VSAKRRTTKNVSIVGENYWHEAMQVLELEKMVDYLCELTMSGELCWYSFHGEIQFGTDPTIETYAAAWKDCLLQLKVRWQIEGDACLNLIGNNGVDLVLMPAQALIPLCSAVLGVCAGGRN
jgi:hypothetical protein